MTQAGTIQTGTENDVMSKAQASSSHSNSAHKVASLPMALNVQVSGKHMDVGEALRTRITDELNAGIGKYFERGGDADVVLGKDGYGYCADVIVRLASGQQLNAKGQGGDAPSAFTSALERIETRIRRYKRRLKNHHAGAATRNPELAPYTVLRADDDGDFDDAWNGDGDGDAAPQDGPPAALIIAESQSQIKTLPVAMAVMELDLSDTPLVLFRNAGHGGLSVVYRRPDGHIGWIDPERTSPSRGAGTH